MRERSGSATPGRLGSTPPRHYAARHSSDAGAGAVVTASPWFDAMRHIVLALRTAAPPGSLLKKTNTSDLTPPGQQSSIRSSQLPSAARPYDGGGDAVP